MGLLIENLAERISTMMAGLFALTVNPQEYKGTFSQDFYWLTNYLSHLIFGERDDERSGFAISENGVLLTPRRRAGSFGHIFRNHRDLFSGTNGIAYSGHEKEPFFVNKRIALCFSGSVINEESLKGDFRSAGHMFGRGDNAELAARLIYKEVLTTEGKGVGRGIISLQDKAKGSYSLLALAPEGIYVCLSCNCRWPLFIGKKEGAVAVSSDPCGFENFGFAPAGIVRPGQILLLNNGRIDPFDKWNPLPSSLPLKICSLMWLFTLYPNAELLGVASEVARKRMGALLARRDIESGFMPDIVSWVPNTGRVPALGYFTEFCYRVLTLGRVPVVEELLHKYINAGRGSSPNSGLDAGIENHVKYLASSQRFEGAKVVLCKGSLTTGEQTKTIVPKIRSIVGQRGEIHLRIVRPKAQSLCRWMCQQNGDNILSKKFPEENALSAYLGVESVKFSTMEDLANALEPDLPTDFTFCSDCCEE